MFFFSEAPCRVKQKENCIGQISRPRPKVVRIDKRKTFALKSDCFQRAEFRY